MEIDNTNLCIKGQTICEESTELKINLRAKTNIIICPSMPQILYTFMLCCTILVQSAQCMECIEPPILRNTPTSLTDASASYSTIHSALLKTTPTVTVSECSAKSTYAKQKTPYLALLALVALPLRYPRKPPQNLYRYNYTSQTHTPLHASTQGQLDNYIPATPNNHQETGFYYYGYRYYDPVTGRWPSRDPIGELGHELVKSIRKPVKSLGVKSISSYLFVDNNSPNAIDINGEASLWEWFLNLMGAGPGSTGGTSAGIAAADNLSKAEIMRQIKNLQDTQSACIVQHQGKKDCCIENMRKLQNLQNRLNEFNKKKK